MMCVVRAALSGRELFVVDSDTTVESIRAEISLRLKCRKGDAIRIFVENGDLLATPTTTLFVVVEACDDDGLNWDEIDFIVDHTSCSRAIAAAALRQTPESITDAVMSILTAAD